MRKFSQSVDLRSRSDMIQYLKNHFRYNTMNSWNAATSYACNLKIHKLGLCHEIENKFYDMLQIQDFLMPSRSLWMPLPRPISIDGRLE